MIEVTEHTIDVDNLLRSKMGDKADRIPRFLVRYLKKIIHQDEVNEFLWQTKGIEGTPWLKKCVEYLDMKLVVTGEENLPAKDDARRYTFVSNHPLGGIDGVALGSIIGEKYDGNFRYLVNDLLMNLPGLAPVCIPINTTTKKGRDFPAVIEEGFASDHHLLMFPAGLCSRDINGEIHDIPWKKTFLTKSVQAHRDIVPIYFSGSNSRRFYRIAKLCKLFKLKVNVAMLYLVDEMYKNKGKTFEVRIGKPIPWQTFDKSKPDREWALWVEEEVYRLRNNNNR